MEFDWPRFLDRYQISYITEGKNVRKGQIAIRCPWCGNSDKSQHCNIDPVKNRFSCWRNKSHRGKAERLIVALSGCTWAEAKELVNDNSLVSDINFNDLIQQANLLTKVNKYVKAPILPVSHDFIEPTQGYRDYIENRRYAEHDIDKVIDRYQLKCARDGEWKWRLIIPFIVDGHWVGWTGRAISPTAYLRYISYPTGPTVKSLVYNCGNALGGDVLVLSEGPMDAMKLDYYGQEYGVSAVAMLGLTLEPAQRGIIIKLAEKYNRVLVITDANAESAGLKIAADLSIIGAEFMLLPEGIKDTGEMWPTEAKEFCEIITN